MASFSYNSIKGVALRATKLDSLGRWVTGTTSMVVSSGFVNINMQANIQDGTEFQVKNANGDLCINDKDPSRLKYYNLQMDFCEVDPELFTLFTGARTVVDYASTSTGLALSEAGSTQQFALEVWTKIPAGGPNSNTSRQWVYWLLPGVKNGIVADFQIQEGPMTFSMRATTFPNTNWGKGPHSVVAQNAGGTAGKLLANVAADEHIVTFATEITPPTAATGYQSLLTPGWTAPA